MDKSKKTIFLVDDDITNLTIGKHVLSPHYNVYTLNSGAVLAEFLENIHPDLILLDVNMPGMNGYEVIDKLKSNKKTENIPVIFLTALKNEDKELKGLDLGAVDYITKPFAPLLLIKRIEVALLVEAQKNELQMFNESLSQMVEAKTKTVVELKNALISTIAELVESRDSVTGGHISRVQSYMQLLITEMKFRNVYYDEISNMDEYMIIQSCQLHDVGKISVEDAILNKPAKLTSDEFEKIKKHVNFGMDVIQRLKEKTTDSEFLEYARVIINTHHERWDGTGYPHGLKGEEIPLLGRMMAIADVYDALVEARPYKEAIRHKEAVEIMVSCKGSHFDPTLIDLFIEIEDEFKKISDEVE